MEEERVTGITANPVSRVFGKTEITTGNAEVALQDTNSDETRGHIPEASLAMLFKLQKSLFIEELERYRHADEKADRYFTILVAVLGASAFALPGRDLLAVIDHWSWRGGSILIGVGVFYLMALGALFCCLHSLGIRKYPAISLDSDIGEFFKDHSHPQVLWSMSECYREAALETRGENNSKFRALAWTSRLLVAAVVVGIIAGSAILLGGSLERVWP